MTTDPKPPLSTFDQLGHALIRKQVGDDFDPFFVHGHPAWTRPEDDVVSCFYYAIVIGEEFTLLFDNDGRGGMCQMIAAELTAIWDTKELLAAVGVTREALYGVPDHPLALDRLPAPRMDADAIYESLGQVSAEFPAVTLMNVFEKIRQQPAPAPDNELRAGLPLSDRPLKGAVDSPAPLRRLRRR